MHKYINKYLNKWQKGAGKQRETQEDMASMRRARDAQEESLQFLSEKGTFKQARWRAFKTSPRNELGVEATAWSRGKRAGGTGVPAQLGCWEVKEEAITARLGPVSICW